MNDEIAAIESALETEQHMMARQRLLKRRWTLNQAAAKVEKKPPSQPQDNGRARQHEWHAA